MSNEVGEAEGTDEPERVPFSALVFDRVLPGKYPPIGRAIVDFRNGYSASVLEGGLGGAGRGYEVAVMTHGPTWPAELEGPPEVHPERRRLYLQSGLWAGVASRLDEAGVEEALAKIAALPHPLTPDGGVRVLQADEVFRDGE